MSICKYGVSRTFMISDAARYRPGYTPSAAAVRSIICAAAMLRKRLPSQRRFVPSPLIMRPIHWMPCSAWNVRARYTRRYKPWTRPSGNC